MATTLPSQDDRGCTRAYKWFRLCSERKKKKQICTTHHLPSHLIRLVTYTSFSLSLFPLPQLPAHVISIGSLCTLKCNVNIAKIVYVWQTSKPTECKCSPLSGKNRSSTQVPLCYMWMCKCVYVWVYVSVCELREMCMCVCVSVPSCIVWEMDFYKWLFRDIHFAPWILLGGVWKCNNDDVQSLLCLNVHCEKVERAPHRQSPLSYCTECSLVLRNKKKRKGKKKHAEEKQYCILIVTWFLLREKNKYKLETHCGYLLSGCESLFSQLLNLDWWWEGVPSSLWVIYCDKNKGNPLINAKKRIHFYFIIVVQSNSYSFVPLVGTAAQMGKRKHQVKGSKSCWHGGEFRLHW